MQLNFDASQVKPSEGGIEPIRLKEATWVKAIIVSTEDDISDEKDYGGQPLKVRMVIKHQIIEGQYQGRMFFNGLNLKNPNQQTVEIAYGDLSAICHATGVIQCANSEQLHNKPIYVKLDYLPAGPDKKQVHRPERNEVRAYKSVQAYEAQKAQEATGGGAPAAPAFQPPPAAPQPAAAPTWGGPVPASPAPAAAPWGAPPQGFAPPPASFAPPAMPAAAPPAPAGGPGAPPWGAPAGGPAAPAPAAAQPWTPPPTNQGPQPPWGPPQQ